MLIFWRRISYLAILFVLLGCGLGTEAAPGSDLAGQFDIDPATAVFLTTSQPQTLDPATTRFGPSGAIGHIFNGLVTLDQNLQVQPDLAAGWEVADGGTRFIFYLHERARFHDGRPVTAADVAFSWERAADPATGSDTVLTYLGDVIGVAEKKAGQADSISGIRVLDTYILEVRIDAPKNYFLSKLAAPVAFVIDQENVGQPDWDHQPNGAGPFTLQEWRDDEHIILARNEQFHLTPPTIHHVVYLMGAGISLSLYEKGEIDLVGVGGSTLERVQDPNDPLFPDLRTGVSMCTSVIGFNTQLPPFDNLLVRQAFSHAFNRDRLVAGYYKGNALPAVGPLPPGMPGYTGRSEGVSYDPELARALLTEAGYPDPADFPPITYSTAGYGSPGTLVTAAITMWQENLGVTVEPILLEPFNYYDELYSGNVGHLYGHGWCADYADPENFLDVLYFSSSRQNLGGYTNPTVDALLTEARSEADVTRRMALYAEIEQLIVADAPSIYTVHGLSAILVSPRLENYVLTPIGVPQWHLVRLHE